MSRDASAGAFPVSRTGPATADVGIATLVLASGQLRCCPRNCDTKRLGAGSAARGKIAAACADPPLRPHGARLTTPALVDRRDACPPQVPTRRSTKRRRSVRTLSNCAAYPPPIGAELEEMLCRPSSSGTDHSLRGLGRSLGALFDGRGAGQPGRPGHGAGRRPQDRNGFGLGNAFGAGITVEHAFPAAVPGGAGRPMVDPVTTRQAWAALIDKRDCTILSHRVNLHGRPVCHAKKPALRGVPLATDVAVDGHRPTDPAVAVSCLRAARRQLADRAGCLGVIHPRPSRRPVFLQWLAALAVLAAATACASSHSGRPSAERTGTA